MDEYQVQVLENQERIIQGQDSIVDHIYEISTNVKDINDLHLEQLILQTQVEYILLWAILLWLGVWLFSWGVKLWKRWFN